MEEFLNKKCHFCELEITQDVCEELSNTDYESLITAHNLRKYLPKLCKWEPTENVSCKECFKYITNFHNNRLKWERNEAILRKYKIDNQIKHVHLQTMIEVNKLNASICRLCLKETNKLDSCFIHDEQRQYREGYLKQIISLHIPFIDLEITLNPRMCMTCLNDIQTFDAFYRMCESSVSTREKTKENDEIICIISDDDEPNSNSSEQKWETKCQKDGEISSIQEYNEGYKIVEIDDSDSEDSDDDLYYGKRRRECRQNEENSNNILSISHDCLTEPNSESKEELKHKLSDFLQFRNSFLNDESIISSNLEINMSNLKHLFEYTQKESSSSNDGQTENSDQYLKEKQSFMSSYEDFLNDRATSPNLVRSKGSNRSNQSTIKRKKNEDDKYSVCFPYKSNDRNSNILVFEDVNKTNIMRWYKCRICLASLVLESQLRRHCCWISKGVNTVKIYTCRTCSFKTAVETVLLSHSKIHDPCKWFNFKCLDCEFYATKMIAITNHREKQHWN